MLRVLTIALVGLASVVTGARPAAAVATPGVATSSPADVLVAPRIEAESAPAAPRLAMWPITGTITSPFGPRTGGLHNGLDIAAPMYTPVRAAAAGIVQSVGTPYMSYGDTAQVVMIAHASNFSTLYAHLDGSVRPPVVRAGQAVQAGQIIAYVGVTGWTTGPHVHFMTIYDGHAVDPLGFLP